MLNTGYVLQASFYLITNFLDELSVQKIALLGSNYKTILPTLIDADQLEKRFGGNAEDKIGDFHPPFTSEKEQLISREEALL